MRPFIIEVEPRGKRGLLAPERALAFGRSE